jgi:hypothetical protein
MSLRRGQSDLSVDGEECELTDNAESIRGHPNDILPTDEPCEDNTEEIFDSLDERYTREVAEEADSGQDTDNDKGDSDSRGNNSPQQQDSDNDLESDKSCYSPANSSTNTPQKFKERTENNQNQSQSLAASRMLNAGPVSRYRSATFLVPNICHVCL